eukprot:403353633
MEDLNLDIEAYKPQVSSTHHLKAQLSQDKRLSALLKDTFDEASFLYDLYKTQTITEMNEFKWNLEEVQRSVDLTMRSVIEDRAQDFNVVCQDIIRVRDGLEKIEPVVKQMSVMKEILEKNVIAQISKSQNEVKRLSNILNTEILLKNIQQVFQLVQKIGYSYDFQEKKILDPLGLSVTLKSFVLDSTDQITNHTQDSQQLDQQGSMMIMLSSIPEVKQYLEQIQQIKKDLIDQTSKKFQDSFENRDVQGLTQAIQIFFNLEILSDMIQARVNQTLRALFNVWKVQIQSLIVFYQTGLNNIFNLYWDKLVHILKQSLTKIEQTEMLKFQLFDSLTALKDKYLLNINKQLQAQSDQILNVLQEIKKFGKFMNPYTQSQSQTTNQNMSSNNSNSNGQAQQHQHSPNSYENNAINLVTNKLNDLIDTLSIHLNTTQTQLDLKDHIETMIRDLLLNLIQQFIELVYQLNFHGEDLNEHLKFNFVLLDLSKNIDIFLENSSMSDHEPISKQIKRLRKTILKQLLTNLESQISFTLNKMMRSIPIQENVENYDELLSQWRANTSDQVLQYFIPQKIQDYQQMIIDANMSFEQLEKLGEYRNLKVKFSKSLILTFCLLVGS